eukprot:3789793-Prorocentrum_lima.AAC.1
MIFHVAIRGASHQLVEGIFDADRGSLWPQVPHICSEREWAHLGTQYQPGNKILVSGCDARV